MVRGTSWAGMDESRSPVNRKICNIALGQLRLFNTALLFSHLLRTRPPSVPSLYIWGFGVPPYPTHKGTFHGGLPSEATHYGIQRLPPDSELYTPRRMVPTGYRVPSPIVRRKSSCLRRLS